MSVSVHVHYVRIPPRHRPPKASDVHYEPVRRIHHLPDGSWRLPRHIVHCLGCDPATGKFDPRQAGHIVDHLFPTATMIEDGSGRPDVLIPRQTVTALGHGDLALGHKILDGWHDMIAADAFNQALHRALLQHDEHHHLQRRRPGPHDDAGCGILPVWQ
jgi:hypothetical protein